MKKNVKRLAAAIGAMALAMGMAACSPAPPPTISQTNDSREEPSGTADTQKVIRLVNGKIEIDSQLKAYAKAYQERTGQEVVIESLGGGVDISGQITNYNASGNMPDIFVVGPGELEKFGDLFTDLSGEPWVDDTDMYLADAEGKVIGAPYAVEGVGLIYNADMLEKAGIDPDTLTNVSAQKAAFEKIDGMKAELGIQAVASVAAESGQMYWSTGNHIFSAYLTMGVSRDDKALINKLRKGEVDEARLDKFADYVKLLFEYADQGVLVSGTYDDQLALFAQGKTAFLTQGNWVDPSLPGYGAAFSCGILPYAFLDEDTPGVTADSPSWWAVYNGGSVDAAKAFLTDILLSDAGQKMFVKDCGAISAYKSCGYTPDTPVSANLFAKTQSGPTYAWDWSSMPMGIAQNATGPVFELYAKGSVDKPQFIDMMTAAIADYAEAQ
ncbi:MAG: ABC transporter substrate-binding protein [Clostridiales bacterium]|jgi:raffinose/stachyose/melibiose transport system substrate-binding protein|nr:ABC transporter substrate-binding protein [Clostridiales bacterium]